MRWVCSGLPSMGGLAQCCRLAAVCPRGGRTGKRSVGASVGVSAEGLAGGPELGAFQGFGVVTAVASSGACADARPAGGSGVTAHGCGALGGACVSERGSCVRGAAGGAVPAGLAAKVAGAGVKIAGASVKVTAFGVLGGGLVLRRTFRQTAARAAVRCAGVSSRAALRACARRAAPWRCRLRGWMPVCRPEEGRSFPVLALSVESSAPS